MAWVLFPTGAFAQIDTETLASKIAVSLSSVRDPRIRTAAFSRIRNQGGNVQIDELIDFANVKIVRLRKLQMVDRSKLTLILKEQRVQLSDVVSATKYKELGKILGVDLFIYGTVYRDALVLKGISTQTSAIAWADVFPLSANAQETQILSQIGGLAVNSLRKDIRRLQKAHIRQVSFWNFHPTSPFDQEAVMDHLAVAITKDGNLQVVDRENLELIVKEQKLSQEAYIDQNSAKELGKLYGVDAFIYGSINRKSDGTLVASMKMMNIFNGVIEWADLVKVNPQAMLAGNPTEKSPGKNNNAVEGMALVPEGEFLMGGSGSNAKTKQRQKLGSFYMDLEEVSNGDYAKFIQARKYRAPVGWKGKTPRGGSENLPVVGVSWEDARRYCKFAGKRLPTEKEWEKAARGTNGQPFPWPGEKFNPGITITREAGANSSVTVNQTTQDISPYGIRFLGGNVREWVEDSYPGGKRVIRGGSWATNFKSTYTYSRSFSNPNLAWQDVGFRCAKKG